MSGIECLYCGASQEINHDGGYGYDEGKVYEQDCINCGKPFKFTTSISYTYIAYCQDGDHKMESWGSEYPGVWGCVNCDYAELRERPVQEASGSEGE